MAIERGNIIDEGKNNPNSCKVVLRVLDGGAGFQSVECCGNELSTVDLVNNINEDARAGGDVSKGTIIDESKNYPKSCGLKVEVVDGGAGLIKINCCGNELTVQNDAI